MTEKKRKLYRVVFTEGTDRCEIYARNVVQSELLGFVDVEQLVFGESSALLVCPGDEKLRTEFKGVKKTCLPLQSIVRIDEIEKEGAVSLVAKMTPAGESKGTGANYSLPQGSPVET